MSLIADHNFAVTNTPMPAWTRSQLVDPGWLYVIKNTTLFKVGKTRDPARRLKEARTWLPEGQVIGIKPFWNIHDFEWTLLCGIANFWIDGEWHRFPDDTWSDAFVQGFQLFDNHDRNKNTVDFNYWIGSSGMGELVMEQNHRRISLRRWQQQA